MELDQLEAFVAIVRGGGFTRASAALHLSQPAVSRRIHLLEDALGAPLFERTARGSLLSEAGRAFLPHAEAVLASVHDGAEAVASLSGSHQGIVTLAIVGTLASTPLTLRLRRFRDRYPAVDLRLRTALSAEVSELVRRGDANLGLRYGGDAHAHLLAMKVRDEPMVTVASPRHRLVGRRRLQPVDLLGEKWLAFPPTPRDTYASTLARIGLGEAEIIPIDSLTAQKRMVEAGFGLALLPESSIDEELRAKTLVRLPVLRATIPVFLIRRRRAFASRATQALATLLGA